MDVAVLAAFGWQDLEPGDAAVMTRLRCLNQERACSEVAERGPIGRSQSSSPSKSPLRG